MANSNISTARQRRRWTASTLFVASIVFSICLSTTEAGLFSRDNAKDEQPTASRGRPRKSADADNINNKPTAEEMHAIDAAAMGTITKTSGGEEAQAACDGMLAKSLVRANERMEKAHDERDEAVDEMHRWQELAEKAEKELTATQKVVGSQLLELERELHQTEEAAAKSMAKALAEIEKKEAAFDGKLKEAIDAVEESHKLELKKAEELLKTTKQAADKLLGTTKEAADKKYADLESKHKQGLEDTKTSHAAKLDVLNLTIATLKTKGQQDLIDLKESHARDVANKDDSSVALQKAHKEHVDALKESHTKQLKSKDDEADKLKTDHEDALKKKDEAAEELKKSHLAELKKNDEAIILLKSNHTEELKKKDEEQEKLEKAHKDSVKKLEDSYKEAIQAKEKEISTIDEQGKNMTAAEKIAAEEKVQTLQKTHNATIAEMETKLKKAETDAKKKLEVAVAAVQTKFDDFKVENEKIQKKLGSDLTKTKAEVFKLNESQQTIVTDLKKAKDDLNNWEVNHAARSYCNITHIGEDAVTAAYKVSEKASVKVTNAATEAQRKAKKALDETVKAAVPHLEKTQKLLKENVEPRYNQYVKPHYDLYAAPVVSRAAVLGEQYHREYSNPALVKANTKVQEVWKVVKQHVNEEFDNLVDLFAKECPVSLVATHKFSKQHDIELPKSLINRWERTCKSPRVSLLTFLKVLGVIFVLIFRNPIIRKIWWCICLPFRIVWFLNPIRLCFGKKKKQPDAVNEKDKKTKGQNTTKKDEGSKLNNGKSNGVRIKKKVEIKKPVSQ